MKRIQAIFTRAEEAILAAGLMGSLLVMFLNVVLRKFNIGFTWSEEVVRYLIVWVTFLGISYCIKKDAHIVIDLLVNYLPDRGKRIVLAFVDFISVIFSALLTYMGYSLVVGQMMFSQKTAALQIPFYLVYLVLPIGFTWGAVRFADSFRKRLKR